jgi:competence protein ComEC
LLTLWIITFVFYGIMLACLMGLLLPVIGTAVAWFISWPIRYVLWMSKLMASLPLPAVYTQSVYILFWLAFVYVLLVIFLLAKKKYPVHFTCFATIGLCIAIIASWAEPMQDDCRVTVLDVGQGQCILLQSEGKNYLVDCGSYSESFAADQAAGMLLSQGITRLDGVILTHFDSDHAGGVAYLLTRVPANHLFLPNGPDQDETSQALYAYDGGTVVTVAADTVISFGDAKITMIPSENAISNNESGLAILFQTEKCDILITGDRSVVGEEILLRTAELPQLDALVVGHHGSKYSSTTEFLDAVRPETAVISVGDNSYGHPTDQALLRLMVAGCEIYRTDLQGNVLVTVKGEE